MALFGFVGGLVRAAARILMPGLSRALHTVSRVARALEVRALTYTPEDVMKGDIRRAVNEVEKEPLWRKLGRATRPNRDLFVSTEFKSPYRYWYKTELRIRNSVTGARRKEVVSVQSDEVLSPDEVAEAAIGLTRSTLNDESWDLVNYRMITGYHDPRDSW